VPQGQGFKFGELRLWRVTSLCCWIGGSNDWGMHLFLWSSWFSFQLGQGRGVRGPAELESMESSMSVTLRDIRGSEDKQNFEVFMAAGRQDCRNFHTTALSIQDVSGIVIFHESCL
jgi:hypothetical protein